MSGTPLPDLLDADLAVGAANFEVATPVLDRRFPDQGVRIVADPGRAILSVDGVGTFAIADGYRIRLDPATGAEPQAIRGWMQGTVAALLLAQRGCFALHASVVDVGGVGVAVAGLRGAGKSTTALRLAQRGHRVVTDDVSPLVEFGPATVQPFARPLHIWPEAAERLGVDLADAEPVPGARSKRSLPLGSPEPARVHAVVALSLRDASADVETIEVCGAQAHWSVTANVYRIELLSRLCEPAILGSVSTLASEVAVYTVTRPRERWSVDAVADEVESVAALARDG